MSRRGILVVVGCACVLGFSTPGADASTAANKPCKADVSWSVTATSATQTITNLVCYRDEATAALNGLFPDWNVSGDGIVDPGPYSFTYDYEPIVGLCDGTLSYDDGTNVATGVLKNDGNFHSVVEVVWRPNPPIFVSTATSVGLLQNACSASWQGTLALEFAYVAP
jgi:hypothetical protein